jgi:hypothetical protein
MRDPRPRSRIDENARWEQGSGEALAKAGVGEGER